MLGKSGYCGPSGGVLCTPAKLVEVLASPFVGLAPFPIIRGTISISGTIRSLFPTHARSGRLDSYARPTNVTIFTGS